MVLGVVVQSEGHIQFQKNGCRLFPGHTWLQRSPWRRGTGWIEEEKQRGGYMECVDGSSLQVVLTHGWTTAREAMCSATFSSSQDHNSEHI